MGQGDTYARTFDEPGEYGYHCRIHGSPGAGLSGILALVAAAALGGGTLLARRARGT